MFDGFRNGKVILRGRLLVSLFVYIQYKNTINFIFLNKKNLHFPENKGLFFELRN